MAGKAVARRGSCTIASLQALLIPAGAPWPRFKLRLLPTLLGPSAGRGFQEPHTAHDKLPPQSAQVLCCRTSCSATCRTTCTRGAGTSASSS